jgi:anti-sigma regulatory factor (Ser/Thr protein kinase)
VTKGNPFELEVEAELKSLPVISDFITEAMERLEVDSSTIFKVQLAVEEACTNIIQHGYSGRKGTIKILCKLVESDFTVTIRDRGNPFDPRSVPPPDLGTALDKRKVGGLGIYLMRKLMDEISYSFDAANGNQLTMRKRLTCTGRSTSD